MLKRTIWFVILAVLFLLIIEPNLKPLSSPQPVIPPSSSVLITNEDTLSKRSETGSTILVEYDPEQKDLLEPLARQVLRRLSEAGYQAIGLAEGSDQDKKADYRLVLSMSSAQESFRGFSLFTTPDDILIDLSEEMAVLLQQINFSPFLGVDTDHYDNFEKLSGSDIPSILIQIGYNTNEQDVAKIENSEVQNAIANALSASFLEVIR